MVVVKEIKPFTGFTFQGPRRCGLSGGKAAACSPTQIGYAALRFLRRSADKIGLRCTGIPASELDRTQKTRVRFRIHLNGFIAQPAAIETAGYGVNSSHGLSILSYCVIIARLCKKEWCEQRGQQRAENRGSLCSATFTNRPDATQGHFARTFCAWSPAGGEGTL